MGDIVTGSSRLMNQHAPYPQALADLVTRLRYRQDRGWRVTLEDLDRGQGSRGLTLVVVRSGPDSYDHASNLRVAHYFPVLPAAFTGPSWRRWLFDRLGDVDTHERMEDFKLAVPARSCGHVPMCEGECPNSVERPFAPNHGQGEDPYRITELGSDEARRTSFRGVLDDDGTGRSRNVPSVIGPGLAEELGSYRGQWVAVINQHVVSSGNSATEAERNVPGAVPGFAGPIDPLIFRVPMALGAFLGIGQEESR